MDSERKNNNFFGVNDNLQSSLYILCMLDQLVDGCKILLPAQYFKKKVFFYTYCVITLKWILVMREIIFHSLLF